MVWFDLKIFPPPVTLHSVARFKVIFAKGISIRARQVSSPEHFSNQLSVLEYGSRRRALLPVLALIRTSGAI